MARESKGDDAPLLVENFRTIPVESIEHGTLAMVRTMVEACSQSGAEDDTIRLITIGFSHYCEKVRWALDLAEVPYTEDCHAPAFHAFATLPVTNGRSSATPCVVLPGGRVAWDSTSILQRLAMRHKATVGFLYPKGQERAVLDIEAHLDGNLGPAVRQWFYSHVLMHEKLCMGFMTQFNASIERWLMPFVFPDMRKAFGRIMRLSPDDREATTAAIDEAFSYVEGLLSDGRKFLAGDTFTAADITFAALASTVLFPRQLSYLLPELESCPSAVQAFVAEKQATHAGKFALRLYSQHRFPKHYTMQRVIPRSGKRDKVPWILVAMLLTFIVIVLALLRRVLFTSPT